MPVKLSLSTNALSGNVADEHTAQELFFVALEMEVKRINDFCQVRETANVLLSGPCSFPTRLR